MGDIEGWEGRSGGRGGVLKYPQKVVQMGGGLEYPQKVVEMGGLEYPQTTGKLYNRRGRGEGEGIDKCNQESMIISNIASE